MTPKLLKRSRLGWIAALAIVAALVLPADTRGGGGGFGGLTGSTAGTAVSFASIALPEVTATAALDPFILQRCPFCPTFDQLTQDDTVITTEEQMKLVWRRLFSAPYDASLFDFESSFVVLMGAYLPMNASISILRVESFTAEYEGVFLPWEPVTYEPALSVTAEVLYGGAPPKTDDYLYRIAAAKVAWEHHDDVIFHREFIFAP